MKLINIDELLKELDKYTFQQFHIHHTWKPEKKDFNGSNHIRMQQSMKNYHMRTNGWSDIAQHITLFPDGIFVTGRPFDIQPASIKGWNHKKPLMVEMIGKFDKGHDKLEGKQLENLLKLIKYFIEKYGQQSIIFHRDNSSKSCPGSSLDKLDLIRQAIGINSNPNPLIKMGSRGDYVKELQSNLNKIGINVGVIDGIAGNNTISGVKAFQKKYNLIVDGLFGSDSYKKMNEVLEIGRASCRERV